jgi:hypothetical protein
MVIACALACSRLSMLQPNLRCLVTLPTLISLVPMAIGVSRAELMSASSEEVFHTKPAPLRKVLQEEITAARYEWSEMIWLETFKNWMRALHEVVGVEANKVAISDMRFLIEMHGVKAIGGKVLHIEAADQQENLSPELRQHRSETELNSPDMVMIRDDYIPNGKDGKHRLGRQDWQILHAWGWL